MDEVLSAGRTTGRPSGADAAKAAHDAPGSRQSLTVLLAGLRSALQAVATSRQTAVRRRRGLLQRKLLLGLELLCKLEEQLLFPALAEATPAVDSQALLGTVQREIALMRDLSLLVARTAAANRDTVVGVLEGVAELHAERVDDLMQSVPASRVAWGTLERDMRGLLGRWRDEISADGDIEDDDADPVGLAPR